MKVWIVQDGEPIPGVDENTRDWRAAMFAKALVARGHEVLWWASTFDHISKKHRFGQPRTVALMPGLNVRFLHGPGYRQNKSPSRLLHHRIVARSFAREALGVARPDVVFASLPTPELAEQAVAYGQGTGVPVLVDVRDLWPDHYLTLAPVRLRGLLRLMLFGEFRRVQRLLKNATGITAIARSFLDWGLANAGRPQREADGIFPMGYPAIPVSQDQIGAKQAALAAQYGFRSDDLIVTFIGTFISSFDIQTVLSVARTFDQAGRRGVRFVLVGDGDNRRTLEELAQGVSNVTFSGWFDQVSIRAMLNLSSVGLAPYRDDASMSLPNKPFEYMAAGLPLLSSLPGELETLIQDEQIGLQYQAGDVQSLVEKIVWLSEHPSERVAMGQRASKLFEERFRADIIYPRLVAHLEQVAANAVTISSGKSLVQMEA